MKCAKCGKSVFKQPLTRVNRIGENAIWWCYPCIKKHEPELYRNKKKDMNKAEKDLIKICYGKKTKT
jgi:hypothetical protein